MGVDVSIRDALSAHLHSMSPAYPISWENVDFNRPDTIWIETSVHRDPPANTTIGGWPHRTGFFTAVVSGPLDHGTDEIEAIAEAVQAHFPVNTRLPADVPVLRVRTVPSIDDGYPDAAQWRVPVTIYFESYTKED